MIEIKKPNNQIPNIQFYTAYYDLISDNTNFTLLATKPYELLNITGNNQIAIPLNFVCQYYSIGTSSGFYIAQFNNLTIVPYVQYIYRFLQSGVQSDQSGILTSATNLNAETLPNNVCTNDKIYLFTETDQPLANFSVFKIWFSYYILNI